MASGSSKWWRKTVEFTILVNIETNINAKQDSLKCHYKEHFIIPKISITVIKMFWWSQKSFCWCRINKKQEIKKRNKKKQVFQHLRSPKGSIFEHFWTFSILVVIGRKKRGPYHKSNLKEISSNLEFTVSKRGNFQVTLDGIKFLKMLETESRTYYSCSYRVKTKCRANISQDNAHGTFHYSTEFKHNH